LTEKALHLLLLLLLLGESTLLNPTSKQASKQANKQTSGQPYHASMSRSALILCDYQNGILGMLSEGKEELLSKAVSVLEAARAHATEQNMLIIHVGVRFRPGHPEIPSATGSKTFSMAKKNNMLVEGTPGADHEASVAPKNGEISVSKRRVGAFSTTDLQTILHANGVSKIYLAGISTSGVILSTVRDAADKDYEIVVIRDACADMDPEVHRVLIEKVFPRQAEIITSEQFIASVSSSSSKS
jgi:nicotinamidase-related amidase